MLSRFCYGDFTNVECSGSGSGVMVKRGSRRLPQGQRGPAAEPIPATASQLQGIGAPLLPRAMEGIVRCSLLGPGRQQQMLCCVRAVSWPLPPACCPVPLILVLLLLLILLLLDARASNSVPQPCISLEQFWHASAASLHWELESATVCCDSVRQTPGAPFRCSTRIIMLLARGA